MCPPKGNINIPLIKSSLEALCDLDPRTRFEEASNIIKVQYQRYGASALPLLSFMPSPPTATMFELFISIFDDLPIFQFFKDNFTRIEQEQEKVNKIEEEKLDDSANKTEIEIDANHFEEEENSEEIPEGLISKMKKKRVTVSASSVYGKDPFWQPDIVINKLNLGDRGAFFSQNKPNQWLKLTFKASVIASKYVIFAHNGESKPVNWKVQIRADPKKLQPSERNKWITVDSRENCKALLGEKKAAVFCLSSKTPPFISIRILQTGKNAAETNTLVIKKFDVIGEFATEVKSQ